jgi:hypothetical protein
MHIGRWDTSVVISMVVFATMTFRTTKLDLQSRSKSGLFWSMVNVGKPALCFLLQIIVSNKSNKSHYTILELPITTDYHF